MKSRSVGTVRPCLQHVLGECQVYLWQVHFPCENIAHIAHQALVHAECEQAHLGEKRSGSALACQALGVHLKPKKS